MNRRMRLNESPYEKAGKWFPPKPKVHSFKPASMKVPTKKQGNSFRHGCRSAVHNASMKVPTKKQGNLAGIVAVGFFNAAPQ